MPITATSRFVFERNSLGRFAAECNRAAERTVQRTIELGARTSRAMAPAGKNRELYSKRPGYIPLKRSIKTTRSGTRGYWFSIAPHAMFVEKGTAPHVIHGRLYFPWRGGTFVWNDFHFGPVGSGKLYENWDASRGSRGGAWVFHPGTNAQPFLEPAYNKVVKKQMMDIAKQEFPG